MLGPDHLSSYCNLGPGPAKKITAAFALAREVGPCYTHPS
jgi:hypothetical protein